MTDNQDPTQSLAYAQDTSGCEKQTNRDEVKSKTASSHVVVSLLLNRA